MTKNFFKAMTVAVFAIIAGYNVYLANAKTNVISDLLLANIEALSQGEVAISCSQYCNDGVGKCWARSEPNRCVISGSQYDFCHTNMDGGRKCVKLDGTEYN